MDLNSILSQLGLGGKKDLVYLSVTPGVGLELIQLDIGTKSVKNYSYRPLEYNESLREISNIEEFKNAVSELFNELKISMHSSVVINIPMVLFGSKELPLLLADDAVTEALTSEVEQSYIFKRYEPVVSWSDASYGQSGDMRKLYYSAVQKNTVDDIKNALGELGITVAGIEVSLISLLKALAFTGLADDELKSNNYSWNLMIINQNGYSISSMMGKNIVDYYEEPLAIKSFEGDEIYNAINASAQITLMSYPANSLFIVSTTNLVSAELLANRIHIEGGIKYYDNNDFKRDNPLPVSLEVLEDNAHKISLEAIGVAVGNNVGFPIKFNFLSSSSESGIEDPDEPVHVELGSKEFDISPNAARNISLLFSLIIVAPFLALFIGVPMVANKKQAQLDELNSKIEQVNSEIKRLEEEQNKLNNFDVNAEIKKVLGTNRSKLIAYSALGESVPKKLWITYFVAKDDGKFDIKGDSENVEDIYTFFKNMKDSLIDTKLRLHKLQLKTNSIDEAVTIDPNQPADYEFEVTNMNDSEVSALQQDKDDAKADDEKGAKNAKSKKTTNKK